MVVSQRVRHMTIPYNRQRHSIMRAASQARYGPTVNQIRIDKWPDVSSGCRDNQGPSQCCTHTCKLIASEWRLVLESRPHKISPFGQLILLPMKRSARSRLAVLILQPLLQHVQHLSCTESHVRLQPVPAKPYQPVRDSHAGLIVLTSH